LAAGLSPPLSRASGVSSDMVARGAIDPDEVVRAGRYRSVAEARWFGIRIGVESSLRKSIIAPARPPPALLSWCEYASRVTASGNRAKSWTLSSVADAKRSASRRYNPARRTKIAAAIGDRLEPGPLEVVRLRTVGSRAFREQPLKRAPRHPDHAAVLADLNPELHGLALGIPAGVLGNEGWETTPLALSYWEMRSEVECAPRGRGRSNDQPQEC
jgi:hypothetical protein